MWDMLTWQKGEEHEKRGIEIFTETCGTVPDDREGFYGDHQSSIDFKSSGITSCA